MKSVLREVDSEDRKFGSGWLSGFLGLVMSLAGLATVLCFPTTNKQSEWRFRLF